MQPARATMIQQVTTSTNTWQQGPKKMSTQKAKIKCTDCIYLYIHIGQHVVGPELTPTHEVHPWESLGPRQPRPPNLTPLKGGRWHGLSRFIKVYQGLSGKWSRLSTVQPPKKRALPNGFKSNQVFWVAPKTCKNGRDKWFDGLQGIRMNSNA